MRINIRCGIFVAVGNGSILRKRARAQKDLQNAEECDFAQHRDLPPTVVAISACGGIEIAMEKVVNGIAMGVAARVFATTSTPWLVRRQRLPHIRLGNPELSCNP